MSGNRSPAENAKSEDAAASLPSEGAGPPVFVGGCPRSGTTLLRTMLNSHPHLAVPHETKIMIPAYRRRDQFGDLSLADNRRGVARWITELKDSRFERIGIPEDELMEAFAAAPPSLGSLLSTCYSMYAERNGKVRWGDKRPSYSQHLNALFSLFPDARFVNVVRDPRACAASMRQAWKGWGRLASAVEIWERTDRTVQEAMRKLPSDQIFQIRYEDLVTDEEATLKSVCEFMSLDLAGLPDMLSYHATGTDFATGKLHENSSKPVDPEGVGRWAKELDDQAIAFIEHVLESRIRHHGYEPSGVKATAPAAQVTDYQRVRKRRDKENRQIRMTELKRKVTYRQPTAALPTQ